MGPEFAGITADSPVLAAVRVLDAVAEGVKLVVVNGLTADSLGSAAVRVLDAVAEGVSFVDVNGLTADSLGSAAVRVRDAVDGGMWLVITTGVLADLLSAVTVRSSSRGVSVGRRRNFVRGYVAGVAVFVGIPAVLDLLFLAE